jgi:CubicO group peptidase (beta-lactamase class C family)
MRLTARLGRHIGAAVAIALGLLAGTAAAQQAPLSGLDAYVEKARTDWQVPGVAIAVVKDDRIVYLKGFGVREAGKAAPVDPDTVFAIGSASKAFTGAALAMLVDDKKIAWDGAVHDYLPAFELYDPYATRNATVRDLLSHRTGFDSGWGWLWTGSGFDRAEIVRRLRFQKETLGFRNRFAYANEIYTAAGEIVPAVTGTSWDDFLAKRIFAPLGMTRSHTSVTALAGMRNVATPHGLVDGKLVSFPYRQVDNVGGAGAINASVRDMAQWLRLQLGDGVYGGKRLLSSAALTETHTGQIVPRPGLTNPGGTFGEYGFGWIVNDYRGHKVVQHSGGVDGMLCIVAMIPGEKLGVVVLTNMLPHQLPSAVSLKVFDLVLGGGATDWSATMKAESDKAKAEQEQRKAAAAAAAGPAAPALPLDRYVGTYSSEMYGTARVTLENNTLVFARPTAAATLVHDRSSQFRARWKSMSILSVFGETPVGFTIDPAGQVAALDLGTDRFTRDQADAGPARR